MITWPVCPGEEPIAAYAAGRLDRSERDAIDAHLDTCSACSEIVATLAKLAPTTERPAATHSASPSIDGLGDAEIDRLLEGHLGRYLLLSRIGVGGMGVVYAAYDPELDRRVALKVLKRARHDDELHGEARAIARLAHPNVVAVHDVGRVDETAFVAMEYVDGTTLRDWLAASHTPDQILEVFIAAGRGLAAAHRAGLVHRDFKPSNVMIGKDGRPRVLDFGLASSALGGTPAYMAPEQARGEPTDARADQYAFCVALWEALSGERPVAPLVATGMLVYVGDPIVRALRRGLANDPAARFPYLEELLAELEPPPSRRHRGWLIAAFVVLVGALGGVVALGREPVSPCARAGEPITHVWGDPQRAAVRSAFATTKLSFATVAATTMLAELDAWTTRWSDGAEASCRATSIELVQPAQLHALRQACLDGLLDQLQPVVALAAHADPATVANADALVASLPAPERCSDVALLGALAPPGENVRGEVTAMGVKAAQLEAAMIVGRAARVAPEVAALGQRADAIGYAPLRARTTFLGARLDNTSTRFEPAIAKLHAAARLATGARDLELLAEIWIELVKSLGNDLRTTDEADLFDGYVAALIPQLPDHDVLAHALEHARCTRNVSRAAEVRAAARHCETAIGLAERARPPQLALANAARTRLGHFQRMLGDPRSLTTSRSAVDEAVRVFGPDHPDTAIARYALGIALISTEAPDQVALGIAQLQQSLAIRRAAFPDGGPAVAEALQGLGDALASAGRHAEAVPLLEEGLAQLDRAHAGTTAEAVNLHILAGMSLEELHRPSDALAHDLAAADIADQHLEHREELAAMALRLAANLESSLGRSAVGLVDAERALRLLDRGHGSPAAIGKTQLVLAELAAETKDLPRARAMAVTARATLVTAGDAGKENLVEAEAFLRSHR